MYRESLTSLMGMLHTTHPHFIRCIIPNEKKTSGLIDAPLVLNQASKRMLERLVNENQISEDKFKIGANKVFFRAGVVAKMEELRDAALTKVIIKFQSILRCYLVQESYETTKGDND
ncbi:unnamed protein product [Strongylus vulgaris]|uniref:Myosin motor domain-containing protein n=1 Tax=Strongylus vulgaris TaxID=40348 RepID=A0A3P7K3Y8_STRVU|nr:unnamed protein product [Strongylus vulgaris]